MDIDIYKKEFEVKTSPQCKKMINSFRDAISHEKTNTTTHFFPESDKKLLFLAVDCEKELKEFKKEAAEKSVDIRCQQLYEIAKPYNVEYNHDIQRLIVSSDGLGV